MYYAVQKNSYVSSKHTSFRFKILSKWHSFYFFVFFLISDDCCQFQNQIIRVTRCKYDLRGPFSIENKTSFTNVSSSLYSFQLYVFAQFWIRGIQDEYLSNDFNEILAGDAKPLVVPNYSVSWKEWDIIYVKWNPQTSCHFYDAISQFLMWKDNGNRNSKIVFSWNNTFSRLRPARSFLDLLRMQWPNFHR